MIRCRGRGINFGTDISLIGDSRGIECMTVESDLRMASWRSTLL